MGVYAANEVRDMLSEFDELVRKRQALKAWWANQEKIDCIGCTPYALRVDVCRPSMVAYCGQEYSGAKNYHDAPKFFIESVRLEMQSEAKKIVRQAYEKEMAKLNAQIENYRAAVLAQLASE